MRTQLVFWVTIIAMTVAVLGISPILCALESNSPVTMVGKTLPCVSIARANQVAGNPL